MVRKNPLVNTPKCNSDKQKGDINLMDSNNSITKNYRHLNLEERIKIEILWKDGLSKTAIANRIGRHKSTVSREINRHSVKQRNSDLTERIDYYADSAQMQYQIKRRNSGAKIKLTQCSHAISYIEDKILHEKWSPDAAVGRYKLENEGIPYLSTKTIYNYIDKGLIKIKPIDLLLKVKLKRKKRRVRKNKRILGQSIEKRTSTINDRTEIGHWEIDLVIGKQHKSSVLLTLTERKTRMEIIVKLPDKTSNSVKRVLIRTKKKYGADFYKIFKSITCDNGSEFSFDKSFKKRIGIELFYAHPYSSFERGTNENHNGIIRRFIPKGKSIDYLSKIDIDRIAYWMNTLPRKILNYKTPLEAFEENLVA